MHFAAPIPILRIFSVEKMREFYLGFLGFTLDWEHRFGDNFPLYAQVSRAGLVLHLSEHHGDATPGAAVFLPVEGIAALHAELAARDYAYAKPGLDTVDWGVQMQVRDPFGNTLRFCERPAAHSEHVAPAVPGAPPPGNYRHTDGGLYRVVGMARDSRDGSDVVLYDHIWPFETGRWTRPLPEWASRFTPVTAEEVAATQRGDRTADQARISAARNARKSRKG
jgi:hypothetical protein